MFQKSPVKWPSLQKAKSTLAQMALSSNLYALKLQRLEKILRQTSGSKSAQMAKLWQFRQGHPKPAFLKKCKGGNKSNFSKFAQKTALT